MICCPHMMPHAWLSMLPLISKTVLVVDSIDSKDPFIGEGVGVQLHACVHIVYGGGDYGVHKYTNIEEYINTLHITNACDYIFTYICICMYVI